jgi:transcriptional regulator with XRE-family HTH domain
MHHDQNEEERGPTTAPALKLALGGFRISMTTDCLEHFVALTASHIPYCNDGRRRPDKIEQRIAEIAMATKVPNPIDKYVGGRVRMRRLMLGMSQEKLGDKLGITFQQVQKYEKGTNRVSASRLQAMSDILQVPVPFFFEGAPQIAGRVRKGAEAPSPAYVSDFLANSDGLKLVKAFMEIGDATLRRSVVRLVEEIVGEGR